MTDLDLYDSFVATIECNDNSFREEMVYGWYDSHFPYFAEFLSKDFYCWSDLKEMQSHIYNLAEKVPSYIREEARGIFTRKNTVRGGLWKDVGAVGACIEIHAKLSRLKNHYAGFDKDSVVDLWNYLLIMIMCIKLRKIKVSVLQKKYAVVTGTHPGGLGETIRDILKLNDYIVTEYGSDVTFEGAKTFFDSYKHPRVDVLINNYGIDKLNWIGEIEESDYKVIDVNLKGASIVVNELVKRGYRNTNILNVCSQTYRVAQRCTSLYCASKAGLAQMTRVMARELAPKGFIVNAIAPGKILGTLMTEKIDRRVLELRNWSEKEADEYALKLIPMGRFTTKEEVAIAILKIINLPAYVNGSIIDMTGGQ